jgi:uncharacterized protein (TIGR02421 family)
MRAADSGTDKLVTSEASYLICSGGKGQREGIGRLVERVVETLSQQFGSFLLLELWAGPPVQVEGPMNTSVTRPGLRMFCPRLQGSQPLADDFEESLSRVKIGRLRAEVQMVRSSRRWPRAFGPVLPLDRARELGCHVYGLEVSPIYRDPESGEVFPWVLRKLGRSLSVALRRTFFDFATSHTSHRPPHFHALGRRALVRSAWEVDRQLAEIAESFDFLLQVTPVNGEQAWRKFKKDRFERAPTLHYRPTPKEPILLKRQLYRAPVERIEDPALSLIFRQKMDELDRQITMLQDRNTSRFLHESIQLFGAVGEDLLATAREVMSRLSPRSREGNGRGVVTAETFAERAREEIRKLKMRYSGLSSRVEIRRDITGLMVSRGNLLVSAGSRIPPSRVEALIQHEVGTHVLTYHNGRAQPLRHLYTGLAGYDALQEGLAVLAEYLVGGLSRPRLRLLAGRVVAVAGMVEGATFVETFRELSDTHGFARRTAFTVAVRTYRGGGLTKDAVYLRGLLEIMRYLRRGGELEPLFVGKIATQHIPLIRELRWRGVLEPPPLMPSYMNRPDTLRRLERLRSDASVLDLIKRRRR